MNNPFNPTFGDVPKIFLDTDTRINDLISKIKTSDFARSFLLLALEVQGKLFF
ncbi:hypothetical protein HMPREF9209_1422 [Lactobacillus gasseri 224-1]|uniref:Uncharacterized protein n=1 Tax=Lactobacillus gasseri 224-1 TaxID=679196 RepID=D1YGM3_LACGS|nr:hypothetical protein HMPREF9209_1422 [Lactobacillus gasseri 224-1]